MRACSLSDPVRDPEFLAGIPRKYSYTEPQFIGPEESWGDDSETGVKR